MLFDSPNKFETIHPNDILTRGTKLDFDVLRIPLGLSITRLKTSLAVVREKFLWTHKDGEKNYQAIGLQYHNPNNPYLDIVDRQASFLMESDKKVYLNQRHTPFRLNDRKNLAATEFSYVFSRLLPLPVFHTRLLSIAPFSTAGNLHSDGPTSKRLHIPIETNESAWFQIEETRYHLPADGSAYLVNTTKNHCVGNDGDSPRTHIVSVLFRHTNIPIHPIAFFAIRGFWEAHASSNGAEVISLKKECTDRTGGLCEVCHRPPTETQHIFHIKDSFMLRSVCGPCVESIIRKNRLQVPILQADDYEAYSQKELEVACKFQKLLAQEISIASTR